MGTFLERVGKGLKTICGCFSVAMQQARQSEIDVLSSGYRPADFPELLFRGN
jgi:hypothetical protein